MLVFASLLQGCSTLYLFALLLLLLLLHLRANQEPPGRICESKDPFRFFLRVGRTVVRALRMQAFHTAVGTVSSLGQAPNPGRKRAC